MGSPRQDRWSRRLRRLLGRFVAPSETVHEWEYFARDHLNRGGEQVLGAEWGDPEVIGSDVPAERFVARVEERVCEPFLERGGVLLEIGCGGGRFTEMLLGRAERVIAADAAPAMLSALRRRLGERPGLETLQLDGRSLRPVADGSVGAVFTYDVFVHLDHATIYGYLHEIARVLRPGGRAVVHHANSVSELGWRKFAADAERAARGLPPRGAFTPMTPEWMRAMAERAGLRWHGCDIETARRDGITLLERP